MARDMEKKRETAAAWYEKNKEEVKRKARERAAKRRGTEAYAKWLESSRERRKDLKRKYRREAGARKREDIAAAAVERKKIKAAAANLIGPPNPSKANIGDAAFYSWRTENDPVFYAKELDRAQRYKARTRHGYKDSILRWQDMPPEVVLAKHQMYLVSKQIRGVLEDEKHC